MAKKLVAGKDGRIYDAALSKNDSTKMTKNRADRTDECICAVAAQMKVRADNNESLPGYCSYVWEGYGILTWFTDENASPETEREMMRAFMDARKEGEAATIDIPVNDVPAEQEAEVQE